MPIENWIAYVVACAVISITPGPSVLLVVAQSVSRGKRAAMACIAGDLSSEIVLIAASYLGLGLILAASSTAFTILKIAGVAYMAYLGISQILAARRLTKISDMPASSPHSSFGAGFLTGVLNPKAIMFYMAFLAQFIEPSAPQIPQLLILMATSAVVVGAILGGYALLAVQLSQRLRSVQARKKIGYAGGACLLGGSAVMAVTR